MPSRESVSEEIRARTEFTTAVRQGIEALMGRCGYSRERATLALLKELNRGNGPESKPTDDETFDTMRRHKLGLDEANRAIVVSRAMRRELLNKTTNTPLSPTEALQRLTSRLSLDNILYESGEDDSDDDGQNEILPLKIPTVSRVPSSASINRSSSSSTASSTNTTTTTTHSTSSSRKHARSKKNTSASPRKQMKARNNSGSNSNTSNTIIVGRKRSIEEIDSTSKTSEVETKAATGRPQLRASKRLHRSSASTEASVTATNI